MSPVARLSSIENAESSPASSTKPNLHEALRRRKTGTIGATIAIVARERGGMYGEAAARALSHAVQVADRWHLMENASRAFLDAIRKSMRQIRSAIGATTINPKLLSAAERLQYEGYLRREATNATILALSKGGTSIKRNTIDAGSEMPARLRPRVVYYISENPHDGTRRLVHGTSLDRTRRRP